jgi:hypothetical protein
MTTSFDQIRALDDRQLRALAELLGPDELRALVAEAARGGHLEDLLEIRRLLEARDGAKSSRTDLVEAEIVSEHARGAVDDPTLLSWEQIVEYAPDSRLVTLVDWLLGQVVPLQRALAGSPVDAFGIDLTANAGWFAERIPLSGHGFEIVSEHALGADLQMRLEPRGLNLVWFTRGPAVRPQPYIYLFDDARIQLRDSPVESHGVDVGLFVANFAGGDTAVTPASWTEWFAEFGIDRPLTHPMAKLLSLSLFRSASGPTDIFEKLAGSRGDLLGGLLAMMGRSSTGAGWRGAALALGRGETIGEATATWVGSSFYR